MIQKFGVVRCDRCGKLRHELTRRPCACGFRRTTLTTFSAREIPQEDLDRAATMYRERGWDKVV